MLNVSLQAWEVQSRCGLVRRLITAAGIGQGYLLACGLREKKCESLLRDSASAIAFSEPGRWQADSAMLNLAVIKCRQRIRAIAYESELVLALMRYALRQHYCSSTLYTDLFFHWTPQVATARNISLLVMCRLRNASGHTNWNQSLSQNAPQPQDPDASEVRMISGWSLRSSSIIERPF